MPRKVLLTCGLHRSQDYLRGWVGLGFLLANPSVMSRLPQGDCPSNQTGTIQTCHTSCGPTEATKFMLKPGKTFPKSGGLGGGFKPITDPKLESSAFFSLCYHSSCHAEFFSPHPFYSQIAMSACSFTPKSPNTSLIHSNVPHAHTGIVYLFAFQQSCQRDGHCEWCRKKLYSQHHAEKRSTSLLSPRRRRNGLKPTFRAE